MFVEPKGVQEQEVVRAKSEFSLRTVYLSGSNRTEQIEARQEIRHRNVMENPINFQNKTKNPSKSTNPVDFIPTVCGSWM